MREFLESGTKPRSAASVPSRRHDDQRPEPAAKPMGQHSLVTEFSAFEMADEMRRRYGRVLDLTLRRSETPFRVILERPGVRLRAYADPVENNPAFVIVPAPIKRAYAWDLAPSVSVVQACMRAGLGTYLLEWTEPGPETAEAGLAAYADALILDCLAAVSEPVVLAGHSLGGTLAAIFASLHPERVRGLVLLEAPLSFGDDAGSIAALIRKTGFPNTRRAGESVPGTVLDMFSVMASPTSFVWWQWLDRFASLTDPAALRTHELVERWTLDEFPLPRALVEEVVDRLYGEDRFMNGTLAIGSRTAAAANVAAPVFGVVDPQSDVVPPTSVLPFFDAVRSRDKQVLQYGGDIGVGLRHLGILVGRSAHRFLWPQILAWARGR